MSRGLAIVLTLLVIAAAVFAGWYSNRRVTHFPTELQAQFNDCVIGPGRTEREPVQDEFQAQWFGGVLADLREPSLVQRPVNSPRAVRFTWIRSFHPPVSVRVDTRDDGRLVMTARRLVATGYKPVRDGPFSGEVVRVLSDTEALALAAVVVETAVLEAPSSGCTGGVVDGAAWIVEVSDPEFGYRYHYRQSPQDGPVHAVGRNLVSLTGWDVEPAY